MEQSEREDIIETIEKTFLYVGRAMPEGAVIEWWLVSQ